MEKLNNKGFTPLVAIGIMILIGIISFTGWYVWQARNNTNQTLENIVKTNIEAPKTTNNEDDTTKDWKVYSNSDGQFSLKYPPIWAEATNQQYCSPELFLLGANTSSVGKCGSDGVGQIIISSDKGNLRSNYELPPSSYPDVKTEEVSINNVKGQRQSGTYKGSTEGIAPEEDEKDVVYIFYANGRTYLARYSGRTSYPDVLKDFDTMITKTFKFQP